MGVTEKFGGFKRRRILGAFYRLVLTYAKLVVTLACGVSIVALLYQKNG